MRRVRLVLLLLVAATLACNRELPATRTPEATATRQWKAVVAGPFVNVRAAPDGTVIGTLRAGDAVEVLECASNWCRVREPGGWIWQGCLSYRPAGLECRAK